MANQSLKGAPRLVAAWRNSRAGFRDIWRGEEAFRIEMALWVMSMPVALWLTRDVFAAAVLIAAGLLLLIVEVLNSAIEAVVDRIGTERHDLSRMAKDLGSLAVLMASALLALVWGAAFWVYFPM